MSHTTDPQPLGDFVAEWRRLGLIPDGPPTAPATPIDTAAYIRERRLERFKEICPPEFLQAIDRTKIANVAAWDEADAWPGTHPGIWLWSNDTGEAKTRMLWRKFGQLHVDHGKSVMRTTGLHLAEDYRDCIHRAATTAFYGRFGRIDVVMLDDLDKIPLPQMGQGFRASEEADRNGRMLRELFDGFYEDHTPVLVTANEPIAWFGARLGPSGERRMREVCKEIEFK